MKKTFLAITLIVLLGSCSKEPLAENCNVLKQGIASNDISQVQTAMEAIIAELGDATYSQANFTRLAQRLSSGCSFIVTADCFDCVKTLPSQSEITLSFTASGTSYTKVIDLSYTPANKMVFRNMHD